MTGHAYVKFRNVLPFYVRDKSILEFWHHSRKSGGRTGLGTRPLQISIRTMAEKPQGRMPR